MTDQIGRFVTFQLDDNTYALSLDSVRRVFPAVEITPLPKAPAIIDGIVNIHGEIIPVVNVRKRFNLPLRPLDIHDQLLVAKTSIRSVAFVVDRALEVVIISPAEIEDSVKIVPGLEYLVGVAKLSDGMVLIHDLDQFLSLEEETLLNDALTNEISEEL